MTGISCEQTTACTYTFNDTAECERVRVRVDVRTNEQEKRFGTKETTGGANCAAVIIPLVLATTVG